MPYDPNTDPVLVAFRNEIQADQMQAHGGVTISIPPLISPDKSQLVDEIEGMLFEFNTLCDQLNAQVQAALDDMNAEYKKLAAAQSGIDTSTQDGKDDYAAYQDLINDTKNSILTAVLAQNALQAFQTQKNDEATQAIADIIMIQYQVPDGLGDGGTIAMTEYDDPDDVEGIFTC